MENKNYVVAIDLGTTNVSIAVGERTPEGLSVAALVTKPCQGVHAGQVENIELVARAIDEAKAEIREQLGIRITEAYAGISGPYVRCASHRDYVFTEDKLGGVSQSDVDRLFDRMRNVQAPGDEVVMERIPQNYLTDNNTEVQNPVGCFSGKLTSTFNFILCAQTPIQRLELAMKRCGILLKEVFTNPQVVADSVLSPDDREEGVAVVNIGGGVTDVAVYYSNVLRYVASIPLGGNAINRDIRSQSIPERFVERLKCRYGSAVMELAPDKQIHIDGRTARESKDILVKNLASVVEARMKDIVEYVQMELKNSGYAQRLNYGLVLTGGTARMKDVDELFRRQTKYDVRIGIPEEGITEASRPLVQSPEAATVVGLLLRGAKAGACTTPIDEGWLEQRRNEERERLAAEEAERQREAALREAELQRQREEELKRRQIEELKRQIDNLQGAEQPTTPAQPVSTPKPEPAKVIAPEAPRPAPQPVQPKPTPAPQPVQPQPAPVQPTQPVQPQPAPKVVEQSKATEATPAQEVPTEATSGKKRNWKSLFSQVINTVNDKFEKVGSGNDDEEI